MAEPRSMPIVITVTPDVAAIIDRLTTVLADIATALAAPEAPMSYTEALAANGGLLNPPGSDRCDHRWRTFAGPADLYGCCVRCAQRCLTCSGGLNRETTGLVCQTCGTDYGTPRG